MRIKPQSQLSGSHHATEVPGTQGPGLPSSEEPTWEGNHRPRAETTLAREMACSQRAWGLRTEKLQPRAEEEKGGKPLSRAAGAFRPSLTMDGGEVAKKQASWGAFGTATHPEALMLRIRVTQEDTETITAS